MIRVILSCHDCSWRTALDEHETVERLHSVGILRRESNPDEQLVAELLPLAVAKMACPACGTIGLRIGERDDNRDWSGDGELGNRELDDGEPDDQWNDAVVCEICRQPILPERIAVVPNTKRCASCQSEAEAGREPEEPDYCPKCGSLMVLRTGNAGGVTRYKLFCTGSPPCRV